MDPHVIQPEVNNFRTGIPAQPVARPIVYDQRQTSVSNANANFQPKPLGQSLETRQPDQISRQISMHKRTTIRYDQDKDDKLLSHSSTSFTPSSHIQQG